MRLTSIPALCGVGSDKSKSKFVKVVGVCEKSVKDKIHLAEPIIELFQAKIKIIIPKEIDDE